MGWLLRRVTAVGPQRRGAGAVQGVIPPGTLGEGQAGRC